MATRMSGAQEVAARSDFVDGVEGQRFGAQIEWRQDPPHTFDDLVADHHHLQRAGQPRLDVADVVHQVGAAQHRSECPDSTLGTGLRIRELRVRAAGESPGRKVVVVAPELGHDHAVANELGTEIGGDAGLHVERSGARAVEDGGARPSQLGDRQSAQNLGVGHGDAARRSHRRRRSVDRSRGVDEGQALVGHQQHLAQHLLRVLQGRRGLQIGDQERLERQLLGAAGDRFGHGDDVGQADLIPGGDDRRLDGVLHHGEKSAAV